MDATTLILSGCLIFGLAYIVGMVKDSQIEVE